MIPVRTDGASVLPLEPGAPAARARELVVIVDDQSTGRRVLAQVIRGISAEIETVCFQDAPAAIDFLGSRTPDLILTDYLMPGINGISFIRRVRKLPGLGEVPIIVVTVVDDRHVLYRALEAGATDFLKRPIDEHECRARCRNLLTLRRQQQIISLRARHLEESERRFRIMADELPLMIWMQDEASGAGFANQACRDFLGLSEGTAADVCWERLIHPQDRGAYVGELQAHQVAHQPFHGECRVRRVDGVWRWLECFVRPYATPDGKVVGVVGVSIDITERKAAEAALQSSHLQLEARGEQLARLTSQLTLTEQRARRRIAKAVQDDLQQLLVGAAFGVERISRGVGAPGAAPGLQDALTEVGDGLKQAINLARSLVDDLTPLILHEVGLPEALQSLARRMREQFGLTVQLTLDASLPPIQEDLRILIFEEVREALLNTVQHAGCGEAAVVVSRSEDGYLQIQVEDAGVGFDIDWSADGSERQGGYGLFSMRERLRALGGSAHIDSAPGRGTRVLLRAPLACTSMPQTLGTSAADPPAEQSGSRVDAAIDRIRILLVDDHTMVRRALASTLEDDEGLRIVGEAADGLEAIRQVELLQPDIVLMDFAMPRLNGLEATRRIKARWPEVEVIGLSMYDEADRAEAMIAAGARAYLSKTGDIGALLSVIREGGTGARATGA